MTHIDDLDFQIDSLHYSIRGMMNTLYKLEDEREKEMNRILRTLEYKTGCKCAYEKVGRATSRLILNPKCEVHADVYRLVHHRNETIST